MIGRFPDLPIIQVRVRPHPLITLEPGLAAARLDDKRFFSISTGLLEPELEWADVVLYASSTIGLEAVSMDIPAVFLDVDDLLHTDPMFGWDDFKWTAAGQAELLDALLDIEELSDERFQSAQIGGREYSARYLVPISDSALAAFSGRPPEPSAAGPNRHEPPQLYRPTLK